MTETTRGRYCYEYLLFSQFYRARNNKNTAQLLVGPNALWPTQPKFWVGQPGPRCSPPPMRIHNLCWAVLL